MQSGPQWITFRPSSHFALLFQHGFLVSRAHSPRCDFAIFCRGPVDCRDCHLGRSPMDYGPVAHRTGHPPPGTRGGCGWILGTGCLYRRRSSDSSRPASCTGWCGGCPFCGVAGSRKSRKRRFYRFLRSHHRLDAHGCDEYGTRGCKAHWCAWPVDIVGAIFAVRACGRPGVRGSFRVCLARFRPNGSEDADGSGALVGSWGVYRVDLGFI